MYATLVGQEFRSHGRACAVITGLDLLTGLLLTGLGMLPVPVLGELCARLGLLVLGALPVIVLVYLAVVYWQTMYGQRGYFTFSLPVRGRVVFWAKVTHGSCWLLMSSAVMIIALALHVWLLSIPEGKRLGDLVDVLRGYYDAIDARFLWAMVALALVSALCIVIECAGVMSVGARSRWAHLGIGAPIIGLVLLEVVSQALSLVLMLVVPVGLRLDGPEGGGMRLVVGDMATPLLDAIRGGTDPTTVGLGSALLGPLLATVLAIWAVNSIEHHTSHRAPHLAALSGSRRCAARRSSGRCRSAGPWRSAGIVAERKATAPSTSTTMRMTRPSSTSPGPRWTGVRRSCPRAPSRCSSCSPRPGASDSGEALLLSSAAGRAGRSPGAQPLVSSTARENSASIAGFGRWVRSETTIATTRFATKPGSSSYRVKTPPRVSPRWSQRNTSAAPTIMPEAAPAVVSRRHHRASRVVGPKPAPKPAQAKATRPRIVSLRPTARAMATTATASTPMRPAQTPLAGVRGLRVTPR